MRDVMLITHFIGLAMGLGTSFAMQFISMAASKMENDEKSKLILNTSVLTKMGHIGITLLFLSGGYLMTPYWSVLGTMPLLITKLVLFLVLSALIGIMSAKLKKAKAGDLSQLAVVKKMSPFALLTGLIIVVLAVSVFH